MTNSIQENPITDTGFWAYSNALMAGLGSLSHDWLAWAIEERELLHFEYSEDRQNFELTDAQESGVLSLELASAIPGKVLHRTQPWNFNQSAFSFLSDSIRVTKTNGLEGDSSIAQIKKQSQWPTRQEQIAQKLTEQKQKGVSAVQLELIRYKNTHGACFTECLVR